MRKTVPRLEPGDENRLTASEVFDSLYFYQCKKYTGKLIEGYEQGDIYSEIAISVLYACSKRDPQADTGEFITYVDTSVVNHLRNVKRRASRFQGPPSFLECGECGAVSDRTIGRRVSCSICGSFRWLLRYRSETYRPSLLDIDTVADTVLDEELGYGQVEAAETLKSIHNECKNKTTQGYLLKAMNGHTLTARNIQQIRRHTMHMINGEV